MNLVNLAEQPGAWMEYDPVRRINIFPVDGRRKHVLGVGCWCNPKPLEDDPTVLVHNDA